MMNSLKLFYQAPFIEPGMNFSLSVRKERKWIQEKKMKDYPEFFKADDKLIWLENRLADGWLEGL